ncbi:GNAT family N-acetyltransferase [Pedococcus sp. NPDC057267]|uniref:GNAT family N-acetyltransferase n=1 Tax=Pedococcus sp. NPDC057267 TaxID=3346077 RepID=UPI00364391E4
MTNPIWDNIARGQSVDLARFQSTDFEAVHAFASNPRVCRFTTWGPNTEDDTRQFLREATDTEPTDDGYMLAVLREGAVIGSAAVWTTSGEDRSGEMGYTLHPDYWGRGYGTDVATLLLQLGFNALGLERITATCDPQNLASVRVLEKAGLRQEGILRGHLLARGARRDSLLFARLMTDEWPVDK